MNAKVQTYSRSVDESRGRERDLDGLLALELATGSPAARVIWQAIGRQCSDLAEVTFQTKRTDGRTTDVHATASDVTLLIESKVAGGHYQLGQAQSYGDDRRPHRVFAMTIGPRAFSGYYRQSSAFFDAFVPIEDIAVALREALRAPGLHPELAAGYRHRAERYDFLVKPATPAPIELVVNFGRSYRRLAEERTNGRVRVSEGSFTRGRWARLEAPSISNRLLAHVQ